MANRNGRTRDRARTSVTPLVNGRFLFLSFLVRNRIHLVQLCCAVQVAICTVLVVAELPVMTSGTLLRKAKQSKPNEKPKSTVVGAPNLRRILFRIRIHGGCDAFDTELFGSLCTRLPAIGKNQEQDCVNSSHAFFNPSTIKKTLRGRPLTSEQVEVHLLRHRRAVGRTCSTLSLLGRGHGALQLLDFPQELRYHVKNRARSTRSFT